MLSDAVEFVSVASSVVRFLIVDDFLPFIDARILAPLDAADAESFLVGEVIFMSFIPTAANILTDKGHVPRYIIHNDIF